MDEMATKVVQAWFRREVLEINGQMILSVHSNPENVLADYISAALGDARRQQREVDAKIADDWIIMPSPASSVEIYTAKSIAAAIRGEVK